MKEVLKVIIAPISTNTIWPIVKETASRLLSSVALLFEYILFSFLFAFIIWFFLPALCAFGAFFGGWQQKMLVN